MKPYRLKHIPTGMYYQPHKHNGNTISKTGKIYQTGVNGLSYTLKRVRNYPDDPDSRKFTVLVVKNSNMYKLLKDKLTWRECKYTYNALIAETDISEWEKEEV